MFVSFDTETTGKWNFKLPDNHPSQPRLAQLGAIVMDADHNTVAEINFYIKPDGWVMPEETAAFHGITQEKLEKYGVTIQEALTPFLRLIHACDKIIAHNINFDMKVLKGELRRLNWEKYLSKKAEEFCTMQAMTPICKIQTPRGYKWPTMQEAFKHFTGHEFDGAHDAMADVRACRDVFIELQNLNKETEDGKPTQND